MIRSDKYKFVSNFNVDTVDTAKTCLYSVKFKSELVKLTGNLGYVNTVDTCMLEIPTQDRCPQRSKS